MLKIISLLSFILVAVFVKAQEYSFVQYSVKEGLPQTQVYALETDDDGFLWMGTAGGATKFNGKDFRDYSTANGLADNVVSDIINYNGYVWILTNKGVTRVKGNEVISYPFTDVLKGNYISAATFRDESNSLILGIKNHEILEIPLDGDSHLEVTKFKVLTESISLGNIRHIYQDSKGLIWVASNGFLGYLDSENNWTTQEIEGSDHNISDIKEDANGDFYISVYGEGVYHWNQSILKHYTTDDGLLSQLTRTIEIDSKGNIWLASKNGVSIIHTDGIQQFASFNGLPNDNIETVCEDREGNIWLASDGSGVFRFTSDEFVSYRSEGGIGSEYVMNTMQDTAGNYWYGTYGHGVTKFDGESYEYFNLENLKMTNNIVWSSLIDSRNRMWFGTSEGLFLFEGDKIETLIDEEWLPSNKITSIFEHKMRNEIWFGTSKGLGIISEDTVRSIPQSEDLQLKSIRTIEMGKNNQVWLGTSNGVFISDGTYCAPWVYNDKLADKIVYSIKNYKDSIWFLGTSNGLFYTDGLSVNPMKLHPSFGANYINFLGIENEEYLWVGTNYGIFEINLEAYLKNQDKGILHHTENSGLNSLETNLNSVFVDDKGYVWMGTGNGLVRFDRSKRNEEVSNVVPNVAISEVQLYLKTTDWSKYSSDFTPDDMVPQNISLSATKNYLTIYFGGLSLTHPDELRYKVYLEGLDEDWTPIIYQSLFTYPNLGYGDYIFHVKASIDGIHWSVPAEFSFTIRKPYYLTWWFILICTVVGLVIAYVVYRWREGVKLQKRRTEKLVFKSRLLALEQQTLNASMNRHFIFNALNSIQYYINTQDRLSANRYLTSFAKLIRKNLDSSVSATGVVSLSDELERLELYVSLEHMRFKDKFEYDINIDKSIDTESIEIPPMILQPFVENSIWHGLLPREEGGKLWLRIFRKYGSVIFEIEDNGIGYDVSQSRKTEHSHQSKGMMITAGRLDVLKKVNAKKMTINGPFQMNGEDGEPIGTKVIITLEDDKE